MRHHLLWSLAAVILSVGCGQENMPVEPTPSAPEGLSEAASLNEIGRSLAQAIADPASRALLHREIQHSRLKEGKLHLQTFLQGPGAALWEVMARATDARMGDLSLLMSRAGSLEIYLPVPQHRLQWSGGSELIVATQWDEREAPVGVDLEGRPVALSLDTPPDVPTLVIVPAESFDANGAPYEEPEPHTATSREWRTGLWLNAVHTDSGRYEPWTRGSPEFEIHLQRADGPSRPTIICADEGMAVEPYRWNMDSDYYFKPFLVAGDDVLPVGVPHILTMWEDDDGRCVIKTGRDYAKETVDLFRNAYEVFKLVKSKDYFNQQIVVNVYNAAIAARNIVSGNDDYVGTSAGEESITSEARQFTLMNHERAPTGWIRIQWKTDTAH